MDSELLEGHVALDDSLQTLNSRINRSVTSSCGLEMLVGNLQTDGCDTAYSLTGSHLQVVELDVMSLCTVCTCKHKDIVVGHLFLLICQFEEGLIYLVEFFIIDIYAINMQAMLQGSTSGTGCQHDRCLVDTYVLWIHDFVSRCIFQYSVLMNATGVRKGITTHDGLVGLNRHVHEARHHAAGRINLRSVDVGLDAEVGMSLENHGNLLERCITCTLTDAIDGYFNLTCPCQHTCNSVGGCHTKVVMAVS